MLHSATCDLLPIGHVEAHQETNSDSPVSYCDLGVGCVIPGLSYFSYLGNITYSNNDS